MVTTATNPDGSIRRRTDQLARQAFQHGRPVLRTPTAGRGCSPAGPTSPPLWPTADTINRKSRKALTASTNNGRRSGGGNSSTLGLEQMAQLQQGELPSEVVGIPLAPAARAQIDALWPTANVPNGGRSSSTSNYDAAGRDYTYPHGNHDAPFLTLTGQAKAGTKRRLNPRFVAWLMGFPPDWCAELSRVDALRCYGNAVVPAQGAYAIAVLLGELAQHADDEDGTA